MPVGAVLTRFIVMPTSARRSASMNAIMRWNAPRTPTIRLRRDARRDTFTSSIVSVLPLRRTLSGHGAYFACVVPAFRGSM